MGQDWEPHWVTTNWTGPYLNLHPAMTLGSTPAGPVGKPVGLLLGEGHTDMHI